LKAGKKGGGNWDSQGGIVQHRRILQLKKWKEAGANKKKSRNWD